jgi:hypothetical protein
MSRTICALLLLASFAVAGDFTLQDPVRTVARPDYSLGMVFLERWRGNHLLGIERVLPIDKYLDYQLARSITDAWQERSRRTQQQRELAADASGLIPDIVLPRLPIFGEGSRIDISGRDRITLGGRQTYVRGATQGTSSGGLFPELRMEQQLSVVLNGTIGERTKVNIDHDSERTDANNKISLSYTGTEDEVVEKVELGNTQLTIPGTFYTGDLPATRGLFGASAKGKLAGVDVYAIASREESQNQSQSFTGRRRISVDTIYGGQYVARRFYAIPAGSAITGVRVYVDDKNPSNNQSALKGIATVWPREPGYAPDSSMWTYDRATGDFDLKSLGRDYIVHPGNIIEFPATLNESDVVGLVLFSAAETLGGTNWRDSLVLVLLKPERSDSASRTWDYALRNVYSLRQDEVTLSSFRIYRDTVGDQDPEYETQGPSAGAKFSQILDIDPDGDGKLDYPLFDAATGLIWFPGRKPFIDPALSVRDSVIYQKLQSSFASGEARRYYMVAEYASVTESYYVGQPDIENEKVMVNGVLQTRDSDYRIDYKTGTVTFLRPLQPDAKIDITYEYRPLFSIAQKSLVGTRAEWNPSPQAKIGTSVFYRSEGIPEDKPTLGSEPFRRMIAEADASYAATSDAVSAFVDRLPLVRAQAASRFDISAEGALSLPDPNTRGVAYLDDFEATAITRDVSITGILWSWASVPLGKDSSRFARRPLYWRNPTQRVRNDSVFGPAIGDEGSETHDVLRIIFSPDSGDRESWAGMMTCPSQVGMNLSEIENLQLVVRSRRGSGKIHFTVGMSIDEDAARRARDGRIVGLDGALNTEDRNQNGVLDGDEDTGLDTVFTADSLYGHTATLDDYNDDWDSVANPMGTEMNGRLDGEDLDRSGFSRYNHYFEATIDIGDPRYFQSLYNSWQLCRIPLHDSTVFATYGQPRWEDIRLVRVWFDGFDATDTLEFYSMEFTGSRWTSPLVYNLRPGAPGRNEHDTTGRGWWRGGTNLPQDTVDRVWAAQISSKTDTAYVPPFELKRDASGRLEQEASLLIGYANLSAPRRAVVAKIETDRDDYRDYSDIRLYVHDDRNDLGFLVRVGSDSSNYYEYRAPITSGRQVPGRDGKWYEFTIQLDSLPRLKLARDSAGRTDTFSTGAYLVRGNPTLADIRYTALGIQNDDRDGISGGIWFDDMRLTTPRKEAGYGFQARTSASLSDIVSAGISLNLSDPNFRRFSEGRQVKTGGFGRAIAANVRANLDRFLPATWGLNIPVAWQISRQRDLPKYATDYSDLRLSQSDAESQISESRSENISLDNISKAKSASKPLNYTLEALAFSWGRSTGQSNGPLSTDTSIGQSTRLTYNISPDLKMDIGGDNELSFLPQNIRLGTSVDRRRTRRTSWRRRTDSTALYDTLRDSTRTHGLNSDLSVSYAPLEDLNFEFEASSERDLATPVSESLWFLATGVEAGKSNSFDAGYSLELGDILTPSIDFNGGYDDVRIKSGSTYGNARNLQNDGDIDVSVNFDLPELLALAEPRGKARPRVPPRDTTPGADTGVARPPALDLADLLRGGALRLSKAVEAIDFSYSIGRHSDLVSVNDISPWYYRLGLWDVYRFSDTAPPTSVTRDHDYSLRVSSGGRVGEVTARIGYESNRGRQYRTVLGNSNTILDSSITWPDLTVTVGKVHNLFKQWATESRLSSTYRRRFDVAGEMLRDSTLGRDTLSTFGRTQSTTTQFGPLLSWQTTWKRRVSTTLSANYSLTNAFSFQNATGTSRSEANSVTRGGELTLSYSFSAPQGVKLPFLKRLRFSSDLSLNWSLRYSNTLRRQRPWTDGIPAQWDPAIHRLQDDNTVSTTIGASYRFSRSIEAGLTTGYSRNKGLQPTTTETTNLDVWVLFRF